MYLSDNACHQLSLSSYEPQDSHPQNILSMLTGLDFMTACKEGFLLRGSTPELLLADQKIYERYQEGQFESQVQELKSFVAQQVLSGVTIKSEE